MKKHFKLSNFWALMIVLLSVLSTTLNAQTKTKEQLVIPLSKPDKAFKLSLGLQNGTIKVISYDGKIILMDAEPVAEKVEKGEPNQNQNNNNNSNTNINIHTGKSDKENVIAGKYLFGKESNNNVTLSQVAANKILNVVIKVPKNSASLNLSIANKGDISIIDISGEMEITGNIGSITLKNVSGSAIINTVTGNITASFKTVAPKAMAFSALVGNIDLTFPVTFKADVKLKTDSGQIYTDFVIESDERQKGANPRPLPNPYNTAYTGYRMNYTGRLHGTIYRGGSNLMMETMHGNIYIRKGK